MLFSFAFALYFLALYVYGIKVFKKKRQKGPPPVYWAAHLHFRRSLLHVCKLPQ